LEIVRRAFDALNRLSHPFQLYIAVHWVRRIQLFLLNRDITVRKGGDWPISGLTDLTTAPNVIV
jgi:hypothetical protein